MATGAGGKAERMLNVAAASKQPAVPKRIRTMAFGTATPSFRRKKRSTNELDKRMPHTERIIDARFRMRVRFPSTARRRSSSDAGSSVGGLLSFMRIQPAVTDLVRNNSTLSLAEHRSATV